ncbi:hypothetical protein BH23VER1_BH23VER1_23780 [soil metagenome]
MKNPISRLAVTVATIGCTSVLATSCTSVQLEPDGVMEMVVNGTDPLPSTEIETTSPDNTRPPTPPPSGPVRWKMDF